ncbi:hypothetical protein [Daejeonella oryzae]|uniref:hypothetical protein n=1 Tax=Daejeonella oryzae TaxID=1122943 RepID=UPI00041DA04E|nr:hypothetical protein [Daejeonella oryzae]
MEPISDKNLDKLFKQRFEDFETQPSEGLWSKIDAELKGTDRKKKSNSPYWMAAASVLILLSATLYFYKPVEVVKLRGKQEKHEMAAKDVETTDKTGESIAEDIVKPEVKIVARKQYAVHQSKARENDTEVKKDQFIKGENLNEELLASNQEKIKNENIIAAQPVSSDRIYVQENDTEPLINVQEEEAPRRKVKGVGGLVNFVIAQVDKREDKIIEFKESDEGSEISGINLGLVKFKSRNK